MQCKGLPDLIGHTVRSREMLGLLGPFVWCVSVNSAVGQQSCKTDTLTVTVACYPRIGLRCSSQVHFAFRHSTLIAKPIRPMHAMKTGVRRGPRRYSGTNANTTWISTHIASKTKFCGVVGLGRGKEWWILEKYTIAHGSGFFQ